MPISVYIYMDLAFTWALLLSALSAYFVLTGTGRKSILFAALALAFALGGYQAYVGFTAAIIVITLILRLLRGESAQGCLKAAGRALLMGGVGCLLYLFFMSGMQVLYHTPMADYSGANEVGLSNTISNLGHSLRSVYGDFVKYLLKDTNYRNLFFLPLCCIVILLCFGRTIALVRKKGKKEAAFGLVLMIMLPLAMNLVTIITPERSTSSLMSHQMQLLLPFLFALLEISKTTIEEKVWKSLKFVTSILSTLLCWSCVLTAYATHASVAYMYQYMKAYAIPLLARVQEDGEYSSGDRILFAGLPDEEKIQSMNPLYKYSYRYRAVFWDGEYGVLTCWPRYIQYYLSMDTGFISADEYHEVLDSEKFAEMNCYPEIDSIAKIGDIMVVKLESAPPRN